MLRNHFTGNCCHLSNWWLLVKMKIGKKWRNLESRDLGKVNILISKLYAISPLRGRSLKGSPDLFGFLWTISALLSFTFHKRRAKNRIQMHHDEQTLPFIPFGSNTIYGRRKERKIFLIIFFISSTLPENDDSLFIWCRSHNRIIFDIYYKETKASEKKCVHKLVINNLLYSIAYITIVRRDLWRSLSHFQHKRAFQALRVRWVCIWKPAQACHC